MMIIFKFLFIFSMIYLLYYTLVFSYCYFTETQFINHTHKYFKIIVGLVITYIITYLT